MKHAKQNLAGSLASLAPLAAAQRDRDPQAVKIALGFATLAGSEDNVLALVDALREGAAVRLESTVIDPPTGRMGWNDVRMALMLTRDALQRFGIPHPNGEQLKAVLVGGDLTTPNGKTVSLRGVLRMRAQGVNWGAIAAERYRRPEVTNRVHSRVSTTPMMMKLPR
jgi:hypothetical protein